MAATHYQIFCRYYHSTVNRAVINDVNAVNAYNWIAASDIKSSKIIKDYMDAATVKYSFLSDVTVTGITSKTTIGDGDKSGTLTISKDNLGNDIYIYDGKVVLINKETFTENASVLYEPIMETEILPVIDNASPNKVVGLKITSRNYNYFSSENMENKSYFYNRAADSNTSEKKKLFFSLDDYDTYKEAIENAWIRYEDFLLSAVDNSQIEEGEKTAEEMQVAYLREARDLDSALNEIIMNETSESNPKYDMMFIYDGLATEKGASTKNATGRGFSQVQRKWKCYDIKLEKLPAKYKSMVKEIVDAYDTSEEAYNAAIEKYWFTSFDDINENMFLSDDDINEDSETVLLLDQNKNLKKLNGFYAANDFSFYNLLTDTNISENTKYVVLTSLGVIPENPNSTTTPKAKMQTLKLSDGSTKLYKVTVAGKFSTTSTTSGSSLPAVAVGDIVEGAQAYNSSSSTDKPATVVAMTDFSFYAPVGKYKYGTMINVAYGGSTDSKYYTVSGGKNKKGDNVNAANDVYCIFVSKEEAKRLMYGEKILFDIYIKRPTTTPSDQTKLSLYTTTETVPGKSTKSDYSWAQAMSTNATVTISGDLDNTTYVGADDTVVAYTAKKSQYFTYSDIAFALLGLTDTSDPSSAPTTTSEDNIWTWEDEADRDDSQLAQLEEADDIAPYVYYEKFKRFEFSPWFVYANCGSLNFAMTKAEELVNIVGLENVLIGKTVDLTQYIEIE